MSRIEGQLTNAAEEARRQVAHVDTRSPATVRTRLHRHRAAVGVAVAAGVFGLLGATAVIANNDGAADFAAAPESTTVAAPVPNTTAASPVSDAEPVDITHLVSSVIASSELSENHAATTLVDGDLDGAWNDAGLRGVGAELQFTFDTPVAIHHVVIHPLRDEERFLRNYWIQGLELSTDVGETSVEVRLVRINNDPAVVELKADSATVLQLRVLTTYPAEPVGDKPPFNELAIAEIQIFGYPVDGSTPADTPAEVSTTTMAVRLGSSPGELPDDYWDDVHGGSAIMILDEPGYGLAFVPDPTATEGWWIELATAPALRSVVYMPEADLEAPMSLPSLALGFVVSESGDEVTVVGIAPTGTESVTVALNGIDNLQIGETATHPEVDRVSFSVVVPASRFEGLKTGTPLVAPRDAQGSPITTWTSGYTTMMGSINDYRGPLRALFTVEQPLVAESTEIDTLPDVIACDPASVPVRGDRLTNVEGFSTPIEAAEAFLAFFAYDGLTLYDHGYTEMLTPDGAVHYGIPVPDGSSIDDGLVVLITVTPVDGSDTQFESWTVSEWQASGC